MNNPKADVLLNVTYLPGSWKRLITVIKHQARAGNFIFIEAPHEAGKTTFANILNKKLTLVAEIKPSYQRLHPLSSLPQIYSAIPNDDTALKVVILDDASEVSADVLEELISSNIEHYFVILAEPDLVNRVPRVQNSRFNLPLFSKSDCHSLLNKMYQLEDPSLEVQTIDSELVYYESKGFPQKMKTLGLELKDKIERKSFSLNSFDSVNKSVFTSIFLIFGICILLLYLFWPKEQKAIDNGNINPLSEQSETTEGELLVDSTQFNESDAQRELTGELKIPNNDLGSKDSFEVWLDKQSPDHYTIQLYSSSSLNKTTGVMQELDLAETYVYKAKVEGGVTYRLIWGAYPNRGRAQLAIGSLPDEILKQQPWLRSFHSISEEITQDQ